MHVGTATMLRRKVFWGLASLVGLVFLLVAASHLNFHLVGRAIAHARIWPWMPLGIAVYLFGHRLRGERLRRLVSREVALTTNSATNVVVVGYATNNVLPARLGELVRAWMLMER